MNAISAVCIHGLGGTPASMAPITVALRLHGVAVESVLLPGHGGAPADLADVGWLDWCSAVASAIDCQTSNDESVVAIGQSLGASLALWAAGIDRRIAGVVAINPVVLASDPDVNEHLEGMLSRGLTMLPVGEPDILEPDVTEDALVELPIRSLLAMAGGVDRLGERLGEIACPVLLVTSMQDSVTDPANSDWLAQRLPRPPQRLFLHNSGHVATLDRERDTVADAIWQWMIGLSL